MSNFQRRVLVVEDEHAIRGLIISKLESDGFSVRGAMSAAEARLVQNAFDADVAVLDIELGEGPSGIDLAVILRAMNPEIGLVFLTHIPEPRVVGIDNRMIPKNAAYLVKNRMADPDQLRDAIELALRNQVSNEYRDDKAGDHKFANVSKSQLSVLKMVALGMSNAEIAAERGTTLRAVENLVKRAFEAAEIMPHANQHPRVVAAREFIRVVGMPHAK